MSSIGSCNIKVTRTMEISKAEEPGAIAGLFFYSTTTFTFPTILSLSWPVIFRLPERAITLRIPSSSDSKSPPALNKRESATVN